MILYLVLNLFYIRILIHTHGNSSNLLILLLVGIHDEVMRRGGHGLAPVLGCLREECHACALPGSDHRFSGSRPGSTDLFRDHSAYRIQLRKPRNATKYSQLALKYHTGYLAHPRLTENSSIGDVVVPANARDPAKCPKTKRTQTATLVGPNAQSFTAI